MMKILSKEIKKDDWPVQELVAEEYYNYRAKWHDAPEAILLGPNEYFSYLLYTHEQRRISYSAGGAVCFGYDNLKYRDVDVKPMTRQGVGVIPKVDHLIYMAKGEEKFVEFDTKFL